MAGAIIVPWLRYPRLIAVSQVCPWSVDRRYPPGLPSHVKNSVPSRAPAIQGLSFDLFTMRKGLHVEPESDDMENMMPTELVPFEFP